MLCSLFSSGGRRINQNDQKQEIVSQFIGHGPSQGLSYLARHASPGSRTEDRRSQKGDSMEARRLQGVRLKASRRLDD